ncbi:hypothetical protein ACFPN2_24410 [Steroidobacter flavus]|uniref:Uncharacterized protein n=1 Tax=Steroidobacter flavus TaxID=1842136 RepID=A0ABV8SXN4_9GAMM
MSELTGVIPIDQTTMDLELSAQELLALSDARHIEQRESRPTLQPSVPTSSASPYELDATKALATRRVSVSRAALLLIVFGSLVFGAYGLDSPGRASHLAIDNSQQPVQLDWPPPEQIAEGEPVRFANPFDRDEVFEFPPGTTEAEARDAVAEMLMDRAMSRQRT